MDSQGDARCEAKVSFLPKSAKAETSNGFHSKADDSEHAIGDVTYCGIGSCRPAFAQRFKTMSWFTTMCSASSLVTSSLNVYINSQITSLEKHFNISSSTSGFLLSCNDLGFLLTTLLFSYYVRRIHIPRGLGYTTMLFGAAGLLCTVAFLGSRDQIPSPPKDGHDITTEESNTYFIQVCSNETQPTTDSCEDAAASAKRLFLISDTGKNVAIFIIALGMVLQGMAKAPRTAFTTTYIDDNVTRTKTALYLGIVTGVGIFGPSISFALGGLFSNIYVTLEDTSLSPRDPRWIGAWWIGFLLFGTLGLLVAVPLLFFPKHMRQQHRRGVPKESATKCLNTGTRISKDVKDFLRSMGRLLSNPVFMCLVTGSGINLMAIAGIMAFMPKYLETQFSISAAHANVSFGINNTLCISFAAMISGYVVSRLKLSPLACLKVLIGCLVCSIVVFSLGFVLGCQQPIIHSGLEVGSQAVQNVSSCAHNCNCDSENFFPVCGGDGRNYFSPCHAGCLSMDKVGFSNCTCLASNNSTTATGGLCVPECNTFYPYMAVIFVKFAFACFACIPAFMVTLRSVDEIDKPISVGVNTLANSLLGWFPGPMVFGSMIDKTCLLWKKSCTSVGACALYDIELFRFQFHILVIGLICITIILYSTALTIAVCSKREVFQPNTDEFSITQQEDNKEPVIGLDETKTTRIRAGIKE